MHKRLADEQLSRMTFATVSFGVSCAVAERTECCAKLPVRPMSAFGSCPDRLLPLQNNGKPPFVQSTAQAQLLGSIGKGRYGGKEVAGSMGRRNTLI